MAHWFCLRHRTYIIGDRENSRKAQTIDTFVFETQAEYQPQVFQLLNDLRKNGISAMTSFSGGSMKAQMNRARQSQRAFCFDYW